MIFLLFLLFVIVALYLLLIKGWLFKIILFCFGWLGMYVGLWLWVPETHGVAFTTSGGSHCTWTFAIPTIVCLLALATTKSES